MSEASHGTVPGQTGEYEIPVYLDQDRRFNLAEPQSRAPGFDPMREPDQGWANGVGYRYIPPTPQEGHHYATNPDLEALAKRNQGYRAQTPQPVEATATAYGQSAEFAVPPVFNDQPTEPTWEQVVTQWANNREVPFSPKPAGIAVRGLRKAVGIVSALRRGGRRHA